MPGGSPHKRSEFVKEEAGLALGQGKLLGVSLDQTAPPHQFSSIETFDLSRWFSSEDGANFIVLTRAIQNTVKQKNRRRCTRYNAQQE